MPAIYEARQLTVATENAWTTLTEDGIAGTAITEVPAGVSKIFELWGYWAAGQTGGVANAAFRLTGQGIDIQGATLEFALGSHAPGGTNTVNTVRGPVKYQVDIPVIPGQSVLVQASVNGADVGDSEIAVQLVYA